MNSITTIMERNFVFAGTTDQLVDIVRSWRWSLPGDPELSSVGMSRSYITNQPGWDMGNRNPDVWTTKHLNKNERVHVGSAIPREEGDVLRRIELRVSLLRYEDLWDMWGASSFDDRPPTKSWRYHGEHFGRIILLWDLSQQPGAITGRLKFPEILEHECGGLIDLLDSWQPPQEQLAAEAADTASGVPATGDLQNEASVSDYSLSPAMQRWLYLNRQAEYERAKHGVEYTKFCIRIGLNLVSFNKMRSELKRLGLDLKQWVDREKTAEEHERVIRAAVELNYDGTEPEIYK